jgi:UDP-GlcNAc:undecaprenyl-phosphate GlcNAc-1-phosphate transferase
LSDYGRSRNLVAVLTTPLLILLIPIFDTTLVTVTRMISGRPASLGGRDHSSHRLVALGMSEKRAVIELYLFAALSGSLALLARWLKTELLLLLIPAFALSVVMVGIYLGRVRIHHGQGDPPAQTIIDVVSGFSHKRRVFEILLDVVLIVLAYYSAFLLRFDGVPPPQQVQLFVRTVPLVILAQMAILLAGGVYSGLWRYVGVADLLVIAGSVAGAAAAAAGLVYLLFGVDATSPAVFVLDMLTLLVLVAGSRLSWRLLPLVIVGQPRAANGATPVVIYGAGDGGALLVRELSNNPKYGYTPVGFIDDDLLKAGRLLHGFRIFPSQKLPDLIRVHGVSEVLISSSKVPETAIEIVRNLGLQPRRMSIRIE